MAQPGAPTEPAPLPADGAAAEAGDGTATSAEEKVSGLDLLEVVRLALEHDPNIALVETQLTTARGALAIASGVFDPVVSSSVTQVESRQPVDEMSSSDSSTFSQSIGLDYLLRSGLSLEPSIDLQRTDGTGPPVNTATVTFTVRQPLLRDRGRRAVGAEVLARERELDAARSDLEHAVAQRLSEVIARYWRARAAILDLEVLRATEASSRELLTTTRRLVAADVTPAAEVVQLEADLTSREVSRIAGEQAVVRALLDLGREIGIGADTLDLPPPSDPFPVLDAARVPLSDDALRAEALAQRGDLAADRARLEAADLRIRAASNALRPRLDLVLAPSYRGLVDGGGVGELYTPLFENVPGFSTSIGITLSWPTTNRRAEGVLLQAEATVRQSMLQVKLTTNAIDAEVAAALDAVRRSAEQLSRLEQAVGLFEKALENEIKKLRAGTSTVVDLISQRDRLTSAQQRRVAAQLALSLALIDLRFETGTLSIADMSSRAIREDELTTLPF